MCETCRAADNQIATAIVGEHGPGNQILLLGRHSLMNRIAIGPEALKSEEESEQAADDLLTFFELLKRIFSWRAEEGRCLVKGTGHGDRGLIPVNEWLAAFPVSLGASADVFCRFLGESDIPALHEKRGVLLQRSR